MSDAHLQRLGEAIQQLRQDLGWTQGHLADSSGADRSQVSRLEAGERLVSAPVLARIAHTLGTTTDDLLARAGYITLPDEAARAAATAHLLRLLDVYGPLRAVVESWPHLSTDQRARLVDFWLFEQARARLAAPSPATDEHPATNGHAPALDMEQALRDVAAY